jgi:hypothetical protein
VCEVRPANTKEDILPQWARARLAGLGTFPKNQAPSVLTRLCGDCNGTYARLYENAAAPVLAPMMDGTHCRLRSMDQEVISRWVLKTSLLLFLTKAHDAPVGDRGLARDVLRHLKVQQAEVASSFVRLGACNFVDAGNVPNEALHAPGPLPPIAWGGVSTLGCIVWEAAVGDPNDVEPFAQSCPDSDALVRICPSQDDVEWPPPRRMIAADIHNLRVAWLSARRWPVPLDTPLITRGTARVRAMWAPD